MPHNEVIHLNLDGSALNIPLRGGFRSFELNVFFIDHLVKVPSFKRFAKKPNII